MKSLQQCKKVASGLLIACAVTLVLAYMLLSVLVGIISLLFVIAALAVVGIFYRCPHCGRQLGRMDNAAYCKHCGKKLV